MGTDLATKPDAQARVTARKPFEETDTAGEVGDVVCESLALLEAVCASVRLSERLVSFGGIGTLIRALVTATLAKPPRESGGGGGSDGTLSERRKLLSGEMLEELLMRCEHAVDRLARVARRGADSLSELIAGDSQRDQASVQAQDAAMRQQAMRRVVYLLPRGGAGGGSSGGGALGRRRVGSSSGADSPVVGGTTPTPAAGGSQAADFGASDREASLGVYACGRGARVKNIGALSDLHMGGSYAGEVVRLTPSEERRAATIVGSKAVHPSVLGAIIRAMSLRASQFPIHAAAGSRSIGSIASSSERGLALVVEGGGAEAVVSVLRAHGALLPVMIIALRALRAIASKGLAGADAVSSRGGTRQVLRTVKLANLQAERGSNRSRWQGPRGQRLLRALLGVMNSVADHDRGAALLRKQGAVELLLKTLELGTTTRRGAGQEAGESMEHGGSGTGTGGGGGDKGKAGKRKTKAAWFAKGKQASGRKVRVRAETGADDGDDDEDGEGGGEEDGSAIAAASGEGEEEDGGAGEASDGDHDGSTRDLLVSCLTKLMDASSVE